MKRAASWSDVTPGTHDDDEEEESDEEEDEEEGEEDDDGNRLICEETIPVAESNHSFNVKLSKHYEYESVLVVGVSILHERTAVGSLKGMIIDRSFRPAWQFHELCDSESQELQEMGVCFCNDDGTLRYKDLDGLTAEQDGAASSGGFLQIEMVSIVEAHRHQDLGIRCVKALLEWLNARDTCERQARKNANTASRPPPGSGEGAYLAWMESAARKPEWKYLHCGWTLAVLATGTETTDEDRARYHAEAMGAQPGGAAKAEREQAHKLALRKVTLQWARLGFRQAKFGSSFWYVTPSRVALKSKTEVAELQITAAPERQPLTPADEPLVDYLAQGPTLTPATFSADVTAHVARGADLNRMHALHHAVLCGVSEEARLQILVNQGADPNGQDEFGRVALHSLASLIGRSPQEQAGAVTAAKALIALGTSRSATDVYGDKPIDAVLKQIRHYEDFDGAFGGLRERHWNGRDDEQYAYALVLELLEPAERASLFAGVLTPRQRHLLKYNLEIKADQAQDLPRFENRVPRPSEEMWLEVPYWEHIPAAVRGEEVYKSFVGGHCQVVQAMGEILSPRGNHPPGLPTVAAVTRELFQGRYRYDDRYTDFYLRNGGKIEFAIDGLICETESSESFFDMAYDMEDHGEPEMLEEYKAQPAHVLDDQWGFVRYHFLGPKGKVKQGPFS